MRFKKKNAMLLSFALGTTLLATTAIAEIITKSGYDQLKDSVKYTAEAATSKLSSYTTDISFAMKADGNVISSEKSISKNDVKNQTAESSIEHIDGNKKASYYYYRDKNVNINKSAEDAVYYVTEFDKPQDYKTSNPLKEKGAEDIERIADILVGNLKDAVIVAENSDGSKEFSGSLSESQMPALINAVVSFGYKNEFSSRPNQDLLLPKITKDIYVKEVTGKMLVDKNGLIQTVAAKGIISGKDDNGTEHTVTFELSGKIFDVNSTKVTKPDLSGKKVEKHTGKNYNTLTNPSKFIGQYKTDILIEKDGKFVKIGEKVLDITQVDEKSVSGKYHEEYLAGFEAYASNKKDFQFNATFEKEQFGGQFKVVGASSNNYQGNIYLDQYSGKVIFDMNGNRNMNLLYDGQYSRVFK